MRSLMFPAALLLLAACNQVDPITDAEEAEFDCLASITVVEITDAIREGTANGVDPETLAKIPAEKTAEALTKLEAEFSGRMDEAFLEYDINYRLEKIQDALNNRDPNSVATQVMNDTLALGRTCTFGR